MEYSQEEASWRLAAPGVRHDKVREPFKRPKGRPLKGGRKDGGESRYLVLGLLILLYLCFNTPAVAQVYGYVDKDGVFHFSDSVEDIPMDERPEADFYPEVEKGARQSRPENDKSDQSSRASREAKVPAIDAEIDETVGTAEDEADKKEEGDEASRYEELIRIQTALHEEWTELEKERKALIVEKETANTYGKVRAYNRKANLLNERIRAYEEKNTAFQKEFDAYNAGINAAPEEQSTP